MRPGTLIRLSLAGTRTDLLRVALTAFATMLATVAMLSSVTVARIGCDKAGEPLLLCGDRLLGTAGDSPQYSAHLLREPGLRPGVVFALMMLAVPVLALAAQATRIGAPARERRLAALRLAGATPGQTVNIAAGETGVAALVGAILGAGVFQLLRGWLHRPNPEGLLPLPTDVVLNPLVFVGVVLAIPLLAAATAALTLRSVAVGPLGVVRRTRTAKPRPWPAVLIAVGIAAFLLAATSVERLHWGSAANFALVAAGAIGSTLGTVLCVGWVCHSMGRIMQRSRRPSVLVAGRRLVTDPWSGSRAMGAMLAAAVFAGGAIAYRAYLDTDSRLQDEASRALAAANGEPYVDSGRDPFFTQTMSLVDTAIYVGIGLAALALVVAFTERIASRRQAYAALVATGVPRATIAQASLWQSLAPSVPAIALALFAGAAGMRAFAGDATRGTSSMGSVTIPAATATPPTPWEHLALFGAGALGLVLLTSLLSLAVLRPSTDIAELRAS